VSAGYGWVPLAADRPLESDYPTTAVGVLASYHVGDSHSERIGPAAVYLSLTARPPVFEFEDCPEPIAGGYLTPDDADSLALLLIDYAAVSRGSKVAESLTTRDRVVVDGEEHDVVRLVVDADTGVAVYTEQGGRRTPAARYDVGELVKLAEPERGAP
jgi:hypothetical protein